MLLKDSIQINFLTMRIAKTPTLRKSQERRRQLRIRRNDLYRKKVRGAKVRKREKKRKVC